MITLTNSDSEVTVKVYDHIDIVRKYQELGLNIEDMEDWNTFTYGILPEGSHGKFLITADKVATLNTGKFEITLDLINVNSGIAISHEKLLVSSVKFFEVSLTAWSILPPATPTTATEESRHFAVVELVDYTANLNFVIEKDYNRVTRMAPVDPGAEYEPGTSDLMNFTEIINDILTENPIDGVPITLSSSGLPGTGFKPKNVLTAGSSLKDTIQLIADAHFLVAFIDNEGVLTVTNEQTSSTLIPPKNQLVYSSYGPPACPSKIKIVFSEQAHHLSKQRTTLLVDYEGNYEDPWANYELSIPSHTDPTLPHVEKTASDGNSENMYYPYFENLVYGQYDDSAETTVLTDAIKANYQARTMRVIKLVYKDLVDLKPSASISRVTFKYTGIGMLTFIDSSPPEIVSVPPILNQIARGQEFVPPFLRGIVSDGGADYDAAIPGYPGTDDPVAGVAAEIELPPVGEGDLFPVPVWNVTTSTMIEGSVAGVHFNVHARRYEYSDAPAGSEIIEYEINSLSTGSTGSYTGLTIASVTIKRAPCGKENLLNTVVDVVDHSGCIFDLAEEQLIGVRGWASWGVTFEVGSTINYAPCHWCADNRCCPEE